ncbi:uncharacterized protein EI90DRAFT_3017371 [Cantharellus anzutake]|uniref:uncharacterized protein n=1 Tax=Cantharellus anzutake TaxID=1750568 RepID=UPI001903F78B|nr:uncharacterized protein EI90DRAFT_3017371 [Cantharellus anzutake]KAF8329131.1 hypothetical protein EI90DRAFT_3017371 [Cantharellus anzutake]
MPPKSKNSGLGRAILNKRAKEVKEKRLNNSEDDVNHRNNLQSITQERDLDEFLNTAQLAATDFTAEKRSINIITAPGLKKSSAANPFLLSLDEEKVVLQKHAQFQQNLRVPRRPPWSRNMTPKDIDRQEKDAFLDWRRNLAELQEAHDLLLTPFERNIEVWRQLWRVLERSHLIVQIADARNPLRFRCEDLEKYVDDVEGPEGEMGTGKGLRRTLLLLNKADLLTADQRLKWAEYFEENKIRYAFFSAANANASQEARRAAQLQSATIPSRNDNTRTEGYEHKGNSKQGNGNMIFQEKSDNGEAKSQPTVDDVDSDASHTSDVVGAASDDESEGYLGDIPAWARAKAESELENQDPRARVLSVLELEELFITSAPDLRSFAQNSESPHKLVVGLVGYPNVGKSSTINALIGEKKVSVSSTPGKTKHFQTIHLSPSIMLCDCPGLVFPQFATTKAELVCDGVLPIDQLREYTAPVELVVRRIWPEVLEGIYGLQIRRKGEDEGGDGKMIHADDLLKAYAIARGFSRSGQGNPDEARAARYVLKNYVEGRLLFCHPPPRASGEEFNTAQQQFALDALVAASRKRAPITRVGKNADTYVDVSGSGLHKATHAIGQSQKSQQIDADFFSAGTGLSDRPRATGSGRPGTLGPGYTRTMLYPHQKLIGNDGRPIEGPLVVQVSSGKKQFKKGKKHVKHRSGRGYD